MSAARRVRLSALAKINLDLRVLGKRLDGYHELRTVFQTISLADSIEIAFAPARRTKIKLGSDPEIPDNLVSQAARLVLEAVGASGAVEMRLRKRIPMGAGLGGGSSDAAAVLLALPVLAGRRMALERLFELATTLGSDVPFFLVGGTALGIGRGTELYPLEDLPRQHGLLVAPAVHVSTAAAYRALDPRLTSESQQNKIVSFQSQVWSGIGKGANDFESVVFEQYPRLAALQRRLRKSGANPARLTGSGSALFGLFRSAEEVTRAATSFREERVFPFSLVSRARFRALWWRRLEGHTNERIWPPPSRYVR